MQTISVINRPFLTSFLRKNNITHKVTPNGVIITTAIDLLNLVAMFQMFTQEVAN